MIEKNKKVADGENRIIMGMRSNLPLNLLVDDCSGVENNIKKDTKKNLKWNKPQAQSKLTKTNAVNSSFNLMLERNDEFSGAKIDPSINDLNKKCENLTLQERRIPANPSQESDDTSKTKKFNLKEIYSEEELKILSDLVNFLKKYKDELHTLNKEDEDAVSQAETHDKVLKARGHIKKNCEKNRSKPFDRSNKSSTTPAERLQLAGPPSLTLTTNNGRALVYVQNNKSPVDVVPEQDCNLPSYVVSEVKKVLSNTVLVDQSIAYFQSMLNQMGGGELQSNTGITESQVLNIQCDSQPNILNELYPPQYFGTHTSPQSPVHQSFNSFSPQNGETNIGSLVRVNSLGNKSPQQNFIHHSPQHNANISTLVLHQEPFMNYSPQCTDRSIESMAPLNPMHSTSQPQSFKNQSPLHCSLIPQPSVTQQSPQQTSLNFSPQLNNTMSKSISSTSPHKLTMYASQKSPSSSQFFIKTPQQHNESTFSPIPQCSPYTQTIISPTTSPGRTEPFDSSYETDSRSGSSAVTSPGSPYLTSSFSSESDLDFSPGEPRSITSMNITNDKTAHFIQKSAPPYRAGLNKNKQTLRPLGEIIQISTKSAEQTLNELSTTWNQQYIIQLVCVAMSTNKYSNDCVRGFRENLMKTIHSQIDKKQENIWKLAIFVHLEFLKAPDRVKQYKDALLRKHEEEPSLLYIAAVQRNCPLIARYIAEIMHQVGFNPAEVDANGNSILHILAHLGDTHAEVLGELLAASDAKNGKKLFDAQATNKEGKSLLHIAASSTQPKSTTIVLLITYGADTKRQDKSGNTALQYHLQAMVNRLGGSQWQSVDRELAKKLLPPSTNESQKVLERLSSDPSTPQIFLSLIEDLKREMR